MATSDLVIDATASGAGIFAWEIFPSNEKGKRIAAGYGGAAVEYRSGQTDNTGYVLVEDLPVSDDVTPDFSYYRANVGDNGYLFRKGSIEENLTDIALAGGIPTSDVLSQVVLKTANLSDLEDQAEARVNLGLGTAATYDVEDLPPGQIPDFSGDLSGGPGGGFLDATIIDGVVDLARLNPEVTAAALGGATPADLDDLHTTIGTEIDDAAAVLQLRSEKNAAGGYAGLDGGGKIAPATILGTAVVDADARLTNTRTPTDGTVTTPKVVDLNITRGKMALGAIATPQRGLNETFWYGRTAPQSIPNDTWTVVLWDTEYVNAGGFSMNLTNGRLLVPFNGIYQYEVPITFAQNSWGIRKVRIRQFSTILGLLDYAQGPTEPAIRMNGTELQVACAHLEAGVTDKTTEYAIVEVYQNSGGALNILPPPAPSQLAAPIWMGTYFGPMEDAA